MTALPAAKAGATLPEAKAYRVVTAIRFDNGRRSSTEAVIALGKDKDKEPYSVLSWQDHAETDRGMKRHRGFYESSSVGKKDLRQMQGDQPRRRGAGHLCQPET